MSTKHQLGKYNRGGTTGLPGNRTTQQMNVQHLRIISKKHQIEYQVKTLQKNLHILHLLHIYNFREIIWWSVGDILLPSAI